VRDRGQSHFYRDSALIFAATLIVNVATFAFHFAYSRALGINGYGALYSLINVASLVTVVAGILTFVVARMAADDYVRDGRLGSSGPLALRLGIWSGVALATVLAALTPFLAPFLHVNLVSVIFLILFAATQMPLAAARGVLQGTQSFRPFGISLVAEAVVRTALAIAFVHAVAPLPLATAAYATGSAVALLYTLLVTIPKFRKQDVDSGPSMTGVARLAGSIAVSSLAIAILSTADVILARHYLTNVESGAYAAVALVGKALFFAMSFMPPVLLPKATQSAAAGTSRALLRNAGLAMGILAALALAVFFLAPGALLGLMAGPGYGIAARYVFPYGVAMAALGGANGFAAYRMGVSDFQYVGPAVALVIVEIAAIAVFHAKIDQIVTIVLIVSIGLLCAVLWNIGKRHGTAAGDTPLLLLPQEIEAH
jgi:O-antigen/teichoic acid export membrane protein